MILALLQLFFRHTTIIHNGDVQAILLALEQVVVHEVDHLATILPGPGTEDSGSIDGVLAHVVIEERVEVKVRHSAHRSLQPLHLKLGLGVHLADELLSVLQLHLPLDQLLAVEIGTLGLEVILVVLTVSEAGSIGRVDKTLPLFIVVELVFGHAEKVQAVRCHMYVMYLFNYNQ